MNLIKKYKIYLLVGFVILAVSLVFVFNNPSDDSTLSCSELVPKNPYTEGTGEYAGFDWSMLDRGSRDCEASNEPFIVGCMEYIRQDKNYNDCLAGDINSLSESPISASPIIDSRNGVIHSFISFISSEPQNPLVLESSSGYSLKFEKGDMVAAHADNAWRYLEVFKNNTSVLKIDSEEIEPWGYEFAGYDRYDFDGDSYFVIGDWCGGATCGGELIPIVIGKGGLKHGDAVDWPVNRSRGYSVKNGELYIYFYDEPNNTQSKEPAFFRFDKTSGNLIEQKVSELP